MVPRLALLHLLLLLHQLATMDLNMLTTDTMGLLAKTLFTFQLHACEDENIYLRCPHGTTINVQWAQYGRQVPSEDMCSHMTVLQRLKYSSAFVEDITCLASSSLQIVLDTCQDQRTCRLRASGETFSEDPCPGTSKYLQVAFKCRPNEFQSRISCENEQLHLQCQKSRRIVIYSADYGLLGRNTSCPSASIIDQVCYAECTLQKVLSRCHGRRRCTISATTKEFGDPCQPGARKYLSVVYTCVPKRIMKEMRKFKEESYPNSFCDKEISWSNVDETRGEVRNNISDFPSPSTIQPSDGNGNKYNLNKKSTYLSTPSTYDLFLNATTTVSHHTGSNSSGHGITLSPSVIDMKNADVGKVKEKEYKYMGIFQDWVETIEFVKGNLEKFILYIVVCVLLGIVLLLLVVILRLVIVNHQNEKHAKLEISESVPNSPATHDDFAVLDGPNDGIEILSINPNRFPPFHNDSLRSGQDYRTDTANRSILNYYG